MTNPLPQPRETITGFMKMISNSQDTFNTILRDNPQYYHNLHVITMDSIDRLQLLWTFINTCNAILCDIMSHLSKGYTMTQAIHTTYGTHFSTEFNNELNSILLNVRDDGFHEVPP